MATFITSATDLWLVRPRRVTAPRLRVFCFPYAGGGPAAFRPWASAVPADVEFCIVQAAGREARWREAPCTSVEALIEPLADAMRPLLSDRYVLYGHSLGALVAFELARHLRRTHGSSPEHFVASGHRAPHIPNPFPAIRHLDDEAFVLEVNRRYGGIPAAVAENRELLLLMLPGLRGDFSMFETYRHREEPPLACPLAVFGGREDASVAPQDIAAWRRHTSAAFLSTMLAGEHFFVQASRDVVMDAILNGVRGPCAAGWV